MKTSSERRRFVVLGLSITSSWGNGHATTYRALLRQLAALGHEITFIERDLPYYAANRDLPAAPYARTCLYSSLEELFDTHRTAVRDADLVVVGSYVPEGIAAGRWVQDLAPGRSAFYDIDTPVTLADLASGQCTYLAPELIPGFSLYLSFTGGPTLDFIASRYGAPCVRPLYCSADPDTYYPDRVLTSLDLGYLGTYSSDRQPALSRLLLEPARQWSDGRFAVAGAQYPATLAWPANVRHIAHLHPAEHRHFYGAQRFTLNVTREAMVRLGFSPSVRLFEAAACGVPIISDEWAGLAEFFEPGREIFVARTTEEALAIVRDLPEKERVAVATAGRERFLREHTARARALTLDGYTQELLEQKGARTRPKPTQPRVQS